MPLARKISNLKTSNLIENASGITAIGRHSLKGKGKSGLSRTGWGKAAWAGRNLPKGFKLVTSHGDQIRHSTTARIARSNFKGKKERQMRLRSDLGFGCIKNPEAMVALEKTKSDAALLADWIDGRIPETVLERATVVGDRILKRSIPETTALIAAKKRPFHLNITSAWFEAAVMKSLGTDYRAIKPKGSRAKNKPAQGETLKETEAMLFFHMPNGQTIMKFRGRPFDVTTQLSQILR